MMENGHRTGEMTRTLSRLSDQPTKGLMISCMTGRKLGHGMRTFIILVCRIVPLGTFHWRKWPLPVLHISQSTQRTGTIRNTG